MHACRKQGDSEIVLLGTELLYTTVVLVSELFVTVDEPAVWCSTNEV